MIAEAATTAILFFGYLTPEGEVVRLPEYGSVYFSSKEECEDTIQHKKVIETWRKEIGDNFILFCAPIKEESDGK